MATAEYRGPYYFNGATSYAEQEAAEEQRLHAIIRDDWFDLVRYMCGLGFCIFGLVGLYFHQFASYYFLKRYTSSTGTIRKLGRVISCESIRISSPKSLSPHSSASTEKDEMSGCDEDYSSDHKGDNDDVKCGYRIYVVYTASASIRRDLCSACGPDTTTVTHSPASNESLFETQYFQWFRTNTSRAVGSEVALILLKDNPKSACTPEQVNSHLMHAFSRKNCGAISMLGISLLLGVVVLMLASVFEILSMPHPETQRPIGWSILITFFFLFTVSGYVFCKVLFDHFKAKVFLSAVPAPPVRRRLDRLMDSSLVMQDANTDASMQRHAQYIDLEDQDQALPRASQEDKQAVIEEPMLESAAPYQRVAEVRPEVV